MPSPLCPSQDHEVCPIIVSKNSPSWNHTVQSVQPIRQPKPWLLCTSFNFRHFHSHVFPSVWNSSNSSSMLCQLILELSAKHSFLREAFPNLSKISLCPLLYALTFYSLLFSIIALISIKLNSSLKPCTSWKATWQSDEERRLWNQFNRV